MKAPKEMFQFSDQIRGIRVKSAGIRAALFYKGTNKLAYKVWHRGKLLFYGNDYRPGIMTAFDSKESIMGLLNYMALQEGDTDDEYFADYTPEQLAFSSSDDCEELKIFVLDYNEKTDKF